MSCFDEVHDLMSPTYFLGGGGGGGGGGCLICPKMKEYSKAKT